jgi:hypothetical protein
LITETQQWLEGQGFPLEMRTAAEFRKVGFYAKQSGSYVDPDTEKNREIDVEAVLSNFSGFVGVHFMVECKATKKPWVLLSSPDTLNFYGRHLAFAEMTKVAREVILSRAHNFRRLVQKIPWFNKEGLIGYSLRQAHSEKDSG